MLVLAHNISNWKHFTPPLYLKGYAHVYEYAEIQGGAAATLRSEVGCRTRARDRMQ